MRANKGILLYVAATIGMSLFPLPALADGPLGIDLGTDQGDLPSSVKSINPGICNLDKFPDVGLIWRIKRHKDSYTCAEFDQSTDAARGRVSAILRDGRVVFAFLPFADIKNLASRLVPIFNQRYGKPIEDMAQVRETSVWSGKVTITDVSKRTWKGKGIVVELATPSLPETIVGVSSDLGYQRAMQEHASHLLYAAAAELKRLDEAERKSSDQTRDAAKDAEQILKRHNEDLKKHF
jgi:hypothetical protein